MHKMLIIACMAITAFAAFVIAPAASATTLTENGSAVAVGASITATNTGNTTFTGPFNVVCDHDHLVGKVTENNDTVVKGEIALGNAKFNGTGTGTDCTSALGSTKVTVTSKLCFATLFSDQILVTGCGGNIIFDLEVTGTGNCKYTVESMIGIHTTNSSPITGTISEQKAVKSEGGIFCPGEGKLDMDFDLYTTNGIGLTIS